MHSSAPVGNSINDFISKDDFSLHYTSIDDAAKILLSLGRGARMTKVDLKSAFRMIPVCKEDWQFLGIKWRSRFYVDTCLPFGLRSAPFLFNQFADVLEWILRNNYGLHWLIHYLDDYFLAGPPNSTLCKNHLHCLVSQLHWTSSKVQQPYSSSLVWNYTRSSKNTATKDKVEQNSRRIDTLAAAQKNDNYFHSLVN